MWRNCAANYNVRLSGSPIDMMGVHSDRFKSSNYMKKIPNYFNTFHLVQCRNFHLCEGYVLRMPGVDLMSKLNGYYWSLKFIVNWSGCWFLHPVTSVWRIQTLRNRRRFCIKALENYCLRKYNWFIGYLLTGD